MLAPSHRKAISVKTNPMNRTRRKTVPGMINMKKKPLSYFKCIKYIRTRIDLIPAMTRAIRTLKRPRFTPAAETVTAVRRINPIQTKT
jgi:hypothetical protein